MELYIKKGVTPMTPWSDRLDMTGVSVSEADRMNGSPQTGDMIAYNPDNENDRWLIAGAYFAKHYEPANTRTPSAAGQAMRSVVEMLAAKECEGGQHACCRSDGYMTGDACLPCIARNALRAVAEAECQRRNEKGA